jgi:hypothetical protein
MKKEGSLLLLAFSTLIISSLLFSNNVSAVRSSVGVLNVKSEFSEVRIIHNNNEERVYLNVTDYNSNEDIFQVKIFLEYYGLETASFTYQQYADSASFVKTNTFSETSTEGDLLKEEQCSVSSSTKKEKVWQKCNLNLLFVFRTTWFTRIRIIASDRSGSTATTHVDYNTEEMMRSSNMIVIPGLDGPILVGISSFVLNLIAIVIGAAGAIYLAKKLNLIGSVNYA